MAYQTMYPTSTHAERMTTHVKTRAAAMLALPLTALLLTGCSMASGTAGTADPNAGAPANTDSSASASASAADSSTDATFGKTITYKDGLAVTVTDKGKFKPSEYAAKEDAKSYRKFQITLKNGTLEKFDPVLVYPTLQDGEEEAEAVTDVENKIGLPPQTKVRPGKTVKWTVAYGVNTDDLTMDVSLNDFKHDDASFVSE